MGTENMVRVMKKVHPETIIMVKMGNFYYEYGKDAYIVSYLFNYKLNKTINIANSGFPKSVLNKVLKELEEKNISYIVVNKANNYELLDECNFKSKNKYKKYYEEAYKYITIKKRIDLIYEYLLENIKNEGMKEKINNIEKVLYEI